MAFKPRNALATVGSLVLSTSATAWVGYWIYALQTPGVKVWSFPTWVCLSFAVAGAIALAGGLLRASDQLPQSSMDQKGGDASTNVQTSGDVHLHQGVTVSEVRGIVEDALRANILEMQATAAELVERRIEEFSRSLADRLARESPETTAAMADPDVQYAVVQAGIGYARTGDEDLSAVLIDLLADRATAKTRSLLAVVIDDAVSVAPRLTDGEIAILTLFWRLVRTVDHSVRTSEALSQWVRDEIAPLVPLLPRGEASYLHLQSLGCAVVQVTEIPFVAPWTTTYAGIFAKGFTDEEVPETIMSAVENGAPLLKPFIRDVTLKQVNAMSIDEVDRVLAKGLDADVVGALKGLMNSHLMDAKEVEAFLTSIDPRMGALPHVWSETPLKSLRLSAVGLALAHANWRRLTGQTTPLSIWISEDAPSVVDSA